MNGKIIVLRPNIPPSKKIVEEQRAIRELSRKLRAMNDESKQPVSLLDDQGRDGEITAHKFAAHQRRIREVLKIESPQSAVSSLTGYSVETISKTEAAPIILNYEWLGNIGRATHFVGLVSPLRKLHGVACFGYGPAGNIRDLIGSPALCLERGACVHYAPSNSASFLINHACKLIYRLTGIELFFAYADPMAGEYGGVYQAAGWQYLGQGLDGRKGRKHRFFVLPPGADPNNPASWRTTRDLRRQARTLSFDEARKLGWTISRRDAKHLYVTHVGRHRHRWRKSLKTLPYPSPRPELKLHPRRN